MDVTKSVVWLPLVVAVLAGGCSQAERAADATPPVASDEPADARTARVPQSPSAPPPAAASTAGQSSSGKPNIVVLWGDDTGRSNISKYTHGMMGYRTPNIDRIADEGMFFTDYYTENSCTAGRAAFIQGQAVFRTGNSKVGLPGAHQGIDAKDPTIAELLKPMGYATAQFGKNHL